MATVYKLELDEEVMKFLREVMENAQLTVPVKLSAVPARAYVIITSAKPTISHAES